MAESVRYRYKGKFVSEARAHSLSNLKNTSKYLKKDTATRTEYRFHGKFTSKQKAEKLARLPKAKKFILTEERRRGVRVTKRQYEKTVAEKVMEAIAADRAKAEEKYAAGRAASRRVERIEREKEARASELNQIEDVARQAARYAVENDVSIDDALDAQGFEPADYRYYDFEDAFDYASGYMEDGDYFDFFDVLDLETEDKYHS